MALELDKIINAYNIEIIIELDNIKYEINLVQYDSLHVLIYVNGINTQVVISRSARDNVFSYAPPLRNATDEDHYKFLEQILKNVIYDYAAPYWKKFFKGILETKFPEYLY